MVKPRSIMTFILTATLAIGLMGHSMAGPPPGKGGGGGKNNASLSVLVDPASISEAGGTALGIVTRKDSDTSVALTVTLESSDTSEATVDASVEIPAGEVSATFNVSAVDDTVKDGDQSVTISVSANDHSGASASITIVDDEELGIAYRVRYIPIPENYVGHFVQDVNDSGQVVGWLTLVDSNGENYEVGFYYDTNTDTIQTSDVMLDLDPVWVDHNFAGLNNQGAIVGRVLDANQVAAPLLVYPDTNSLTGWNHEILPVPQEASTQQYGGGYARQINDAGDVVGLYSRDDSSQGAFAINTGLYDSALTLPLTDFQLTNGNSANLRPVVSNARKGVVESQDVGYWFSFEDAYSLYDTDPANDVNPVSPIPLPSEDYDVRVTWQPSISHDEQIAATKTVLESFNKKKGGTYNYSFSPSVVWDGFKIWEGTAEAYAVIVNSAEGFNIVGDVIGVVLEGGNYGPWWLQHSDLGYLEIESLLVFDEPVGNELSDVERWYLNNPDIIDMSDRVGTTSLGMIIGNLSGDPSQLPFVLIPEVQP